MNNSEDIYDIKARVSLLEASHIDNTSKITILLDSFNALNLNLTKLTSSINTAVKMAVGCGLFIITLTGGFWTLYTHSTDLLIKQISVEQRK